jgi:predicted RNase H-like HicB family nuclease
MEAAIIDNWLDGEIINDTAYVDVLGATFPVLVNKEGHVGYLSYCPTLDLYTQGDTYNEAVSNAEGAIEGFLEVLHEYRKDFDINS